MRITRESLLAKADQLSRLAEEYELQARLARSQEKALRKEAETLGKDESMPDEHRAIRSKSTHPVLVQAKRKGIPSLRALAERLGEHPSALSRWLNGRRPWPGDVKARLDKLLG